MNVQTVSAFIQEPYDDSIRLVRRLLVRRGLRLVSEIDVSRRLEQELGVGWRYASTLLVVDDPASLYEALVQDSIAGVHVLHFIAVTGDGTSTRIAANIAAEPYRPRQRAAPKSIGSHVGARIAEVIKSIAEHHDAIMLVRNAEAAEKTADLPAAAMDRPEQLFAVRG